MKKRKLIVIDPGHGGMCPKTGEYTTAPNKMAHHEGHDMHKNGWFYEGVWNRWFALELGAALAQAGLPFLYSIPAERWHEDVRLNERIAYANALHQIHDVLFISIHANAFDGSVRGWQVHTSPGETASDLYATKLYRLVQKEFGGQILMRSDVSDRDIDFENDFQVLTRTRCPAMLCENLFFDNLKDAKLLLDPHFVNRLMECYFQLAVYFFSNETF